MKKSIIESTDTSWKTESLLGGIIEPGDTAVLVVPIDDAAPKGRLILPQVQTIRDILDNDAMAYVVKERELAVALREMPKKPKIVITDSQVFQKVAADTPEDVLMTSFSILFARYKGDLEAYIRGVNRIKDLKDGDKVLIAEACTHHVQSDDIGTVKIPRWIRQLTGRELQFDKCFRICFPRESQGLLAYHSLRKLYAQPTGDVIQDPLRRSFGSADHELRYVHRLFFRHPRQGSETFPARVNHLPERILLNY